MDAAATVSGRVAANGAIGNCNSRKATESPTPTSENTACRITAHRGADDRRVHTCFVGVVTNTAATVVADITIDHRQAGCPAVEPGAAVTNACAVVITDITIDDGQVGCPGTIETEIE